MFADAAHRPPRHYSYWPTTSAPRSCPEWERASCTWFPGVAGMSRVTFAAIAFSCVVALAGYTDGSPFTDVHVREFRNAAELSSDAQAQALLGWAYYSGWGVSQDDTEAARWFRAAADQGNALGQSGLGFLYAEGRVFDQDHAEAARYWRLAAEQSDAGAQRMLGAAYYAGVGVDQDYAKAAQWLLLAAEQGDAHARFTAWIGVRKGPWSKAG